MPSVRYYNQTAPFWDFVANMEEQGTSHPFFGGNNDNQQQQSGHPWEGAFFPFGGPFAHRPRHHPYHRGPPPPHHGPEHPPPPHAETDESDKEKSPQADPEEGPSTRGPHCHLSGRGRCGGRGRGGFRGRHGPFGAWADAFFNNNTTTPESKGDETFTPEVDVFDTNEAFVLHISLPGAKKEDVGVSWDAEKSELSIGGVVYRPGDEEFLKSLALDERKVGVFERKVRLGSRANPASVDVEGIVARMEDGVLRVEVPKMEGGFVEVRKVDVE